MSHYASFDQDKINAALEAANRYHEMTNAASLRAGTPSADLDPHGGTELSLSGGCISVTVENGQVCLSLPLGIGNYCLPVPSWVPQGAVLQACLSICTTWGIPTGVKVTVSFNGTILFTKSFLKC